MTPITIANGIQVEPGDTVYSTAAAATAAAANFEPLIVRRSFGWENGYVEMEGGNIYRDSSLYVSRRKAINVALKYLRVERKSAAALAAARDQRIAKLQAMLKEEKP